jgi:hypothetical protein
MINHNIVKHITFKNVFIAGLILVIIFLYTCKKKVEVIETIPIPVQQELVRIDSVMSQKDKDSVSLKIADLEKSAQQWYNQWKEEAKQTAEVQQTLSDLLTVEVPDTCKKIVDALGLQITKLNTSTKAQNLSCEKTIDSKNRIIKGKDDLIAIGKTDYKKLKLRLDTCWQQQVLAEKNKFKPKRELSVGIMALSNYNSFDNSAVGIILDYRNKKGTQFGVGFFNTKQVSVSYKKSLFKF